MTSIAMVITQWNDVLRYDYGSSYSEQKVQVLLRWKRKNGSGATFLSLIDVAVRSGDQRFAEAVKRIASRHAHNRTSL